jgi:hypothetical protein
MGDCSLKECDCIDTTFKCQLVKCFLKFVNVLSIVIIASSVQMLTGMRGRLLKTEALAVMHELLELLKESVLISGVSLDYLGSKIANSPEGFQLKITCNLDKCSRASIKPILERHNLCIREDKNYC